MSEWIKCRICGNIWDCPCPEHEIFSKCYNCYKWSFEEREAGRRKIQEQEEQALDKLRKLNHVELIEEDWWEKP